MRSSASILLLVERGDRVHGGLNKALLLARHFGARLDLFLCDTEGYTAASGDPVAAGRTRSECVTQGLEYLQALRKAVRAPDIEIVAEVTCAPSLREALATRLLRNPADLLVKTLVADRYDDRRRPPEWAAVAECPAPLLLTRGRPWRPAAQFGVAVARSHPSARGADDAAGALAKVFAKACDARLDTVYVDDAPLAAATPDSAHDVATVARDLTAFVIERDWDLVVLEKPRATAAATAYGRVADILAATTADVVLADSSAQVTLRAGAAARTRVRDERAHPRQ